MAKFGAVPGTKKLNLAFHELQSQFGQQRIVYLERFGCPHRTHKVHHLSGLRPRRVDRHQQVLDLDSVRYGERITGVEDIVIDEVADIGHRQNPRIDQGVLAAVRPDRETGHVKHLVRKSIVDSGVMFRRSSTQLLGNRCRREDLGLRIAGKCSSDFRRVEVVGVLMCDQDRGRTFERFSRLGKNPGIEDENRPGFFQTDAGVGEFREQHAPSVRPASNRGEAAGGTRLIILISGKLAEQEADVTETSVPVKEQRVTKQRLAVSAALDELNDFVSTQELYRILQERGISVSLATSYRILQSMAEDGAVDVLRNPDGEAVYRRCAVTEHHHHLLCRNCGTAVEIEAPVVERWAAKVAQEHGFTEVNHTVEIIGLCPDCTASHRSGGR